MEDFILEQKKYLVEVLGKKLINSDERDDRKNGYGYLAKKYWPEEYLDGERKEVHHIDFNHSNNVVSNLVVLTTSEHQKIHYLFDPKSVERRQKLSKASKGRKNGLVRNYNGENNPMYGKPSPMKGKTGYWKGKSGPNKGKCWSEETLKKRSDSLKGKPSPIKGKHRKVVDGRYVYE